MSERLNNVINLYMEGIRDGQALAQVDIFRIENGLVVEHWDNSEPVPPEEEWVNSGKF